MPWLWVPQPTHEQDAVPGGVLGGVPGMAGLLDAPTRPWKRYLFIKGAKNIDSWLHPVEKGPFSPETLWSFPGLLSPVCSTVSVS